MLKQFIAAVLIAAAVPLASAQAAEVTFENDAPFGTLRSSTSPKKLFDVAGVVGTVNSLDVTIAGLTNAPANFGFTEILLVNETQETYLSLLDTRFVDFVASNVTLHFDDDAAAVLPTTGTITSGDYRVGTYPRSTINGYDKLAALGDFLTDDVNGTWYIAAFGDQGAQITGNLTLRFDVTPPLASDVPEAGSWMMLILGFGIVGTALRARPQLRPARY